MIKIVLIADSICGGFGQRSKKSFVHYSADLNSFSLMDLSQSGMCTKDAYEKIQFNESFSLICEDDLVVISLGNVDAKPAYKKNNIFSKLVPKRYRNEKIDPRPYFSTKKSKYVLEKIDDIIRMFFRYFCFYTANYDRRVAQVDFETNIEKISKIISKNKPKVLFMLPSKISNSKFPGSEKEFLSVQNFIVEFCHKNNFNYFDFKNIVSKQDYLLDEFHLNENGHQKIVEKFSCYLKSMF
jgi:lysophospholipase L1-like esterase